MKKGRQRTEEGGVRAEWQGWALKNSRHDRGDGPTREVGGAGDLGEKPPGLARGDRVRARWESH